MQGSNRTTDHTFNKMGREVAPPEAARDPTVASPEELAAIQAALGGPSVEELQKKDPAMLEFLVDRSKQAGNIAFKEKNYKGE